MQSLAENTIIRSLLSESHMELYKSRSSLHDVTILGSRVCSILFMQVAGLIARTKYYAVWNFAECAMIISGLAYNPESGKWDGGRNVRIFTIEYVLRSVRIVRSAYRIQTELLKITKSCWMRGIAGLITGYANVYTNALRERVVNQASKARWLHS